MSNGENKGSQKYRKFDKMSTEVLEAILRADFDTPEAGRMDIEAIMYISGLLAERRKMGTTEAEAARAEFYEYYYPLDKSVYDFGEEAQEEEPGERRQMGRIVWRRFATVAAVFVILMFGGTVTAYALGYNPLAAIGRWTEDFFWFEERTVTGELADKLAEYGYPENIVPRWLPEGYTLDSIDVDEFEYSFNSISATFIRGAGEETETLIIGYTKYVGDNKDALYEKDNRDVRKYAIGDRVYYVMTNLDQCIIAWQNGDFEGAIMGRFTTEEAEKIINSIKGD